MPTTPAKKELLAAIRKRINEIVDDYTDLMDNIEEKADEWDTEQLADTLTMLRQQETIEIREEDDNDDEDEE